MARYSPPLLRRFFSCAASSASRGGGSVAGKKNLVFLGSPQVSPVPPSFSVHTQVRRSDYGALVDTSGGRLGPGHAAGRVGIPGLRVPGSRRRDAAAGRQEQGEEADAVGRRAACARPWVPGGTHLHAGAGPGGTFLVTILESGPVSMVYGGFWFIVISDAMQESFLSNLKEVKPDVCITAAYGNILPQKFLDIPLCGKFAFFLLASDCKELRMPNECLITMSTLQLTRK